MPANAELFILIETLLLAVLGAILVYKSVKLSHFIHEIHLLKQGLEEQKAEDRERDDFLAMLVHELRSPLAIMKGASDLMIKDASKLSKEQIEMLLSQIRTSSIGMLKIVNDILDVSKMESGKFIIAKVFGDFNKVVTEECGYYVALANERQIHIKNIMDDAVPSFNFDPDRVRQVMNNLLSNAIKFSDDSSTIFVTSKKNQNFVEVGVSDTGEGISDDMKHKLFHKFVQLSNHATQKVRGTGLGLVVSKGIVEAHGGKIWIEDNAPRGAKFVFSIPIS